MALQSNDLFVVQSQTDNKLYSLKLSDLDAYLEGSSGIQFRGSVDLNNAPAAQTPVVALPATNGDLYIVESDAAVIAAGWVMENGETSASENDRIVYDGDTNAWILVSGGTNTGGTLTGITASLPLKSDGDTVNPVLQIRQARTTTGATNDGDGEGTAGAVAKLAEAADVAHTTGTGDATAVVTADLLKATNEIVEGLVVSGGAVTTVTTADANGNSALNISPTSGNVVIEINTSSETEYGVVQIANATDIANGTSGPSAVVDASQLEAAIDALDTGVSSVTTTDANGNSALSITPTTEDVVVEIATASNAAYGVVQIASASDITNGTSGPSAVVDASQLKDVIDALPPEGVASLTEGGTDIVTGALKIEKDADNNHTIGVNKEVFTPFDFSALTDITTI